MTLAEILILSIISITIGLIPKIRPWSLLLISVLVIYWLQPALPIRGMDYWLPSLSIILCVVVWAATRYHQKASREDWLVLFILFILILGLGLNRYLPSICCVTASIPPPYPQVLVALIAFGLLTIFNLISSKKYITTLTVWILILITLFILIKNPWLKIQATAGVRTLVGQRADLATSMDIQWLGFSYIAFRLIHILRDRMNGRLGTVSLRDMVVYILFYPSLLAGPLDRVQRFTKEQNTFFKLSWGTFQDGGWRILWGIFKKFALADTLALITLTDQTAAEAKVWIWSWGILYGYALRIYLDFSGYTDIAIGLGKWMGIQLPENFNQPYLKSNLTQFWNSWHITLAQWFRAYFFNPLTRFLRSKPDKYPVWLIILLTQTSTMLLIGLWHGLTWNFAIWGLWHGLGLYVHNRWSSAKLSHFSYISETYWGHRLLSLGSVFLTFHYVALGWVWFAVSSPHISFHFLRTLLTGG